MDIDTKIDLVCQVGEEIIEVDELRPLFESGKELVAYDGMEPSGQLHIAQAVLRAINVNKMTKAGIKFKIWVADWFAWANNKMGGDLEKIQTVGKYMIEVWKASGMDLENVEFIWANEAMKDVEYWKTVMNIARSSTVKRILRCSQIMGRSESETLYASQIFYPCMQCADIFYLKADICQLGMDQRKVNMLAREIGPKLGFWKPIVVSHHMLMGLQAPPEGEMDAIERATAMKMSKSNPDSAIFMTDSEDDIRRKINKAYCPEKQVHDNPIMEYCKYLVFERNPFIVIERPEKWGGNMEIHSYDELVRLYTAGDLHPADLKKAVAGYINAMVAPVREHFEKDPKAKALLEQVRSFQVTR
ncbi:TPA: tyrosine--tRNA ligase [Candidatus Woesearchaeota archaeon]|nr:tyrosine--tRNA ligase [Candidatus Woesearchaeota archaeon]